MAYEAGTAVLEVVPSFLGIEQALSKGARALAKGLDDKLGGSLGKAMDKAAKDAERSSERAGQKLGQIFAERAIKQVETAMNSIPDSDRVLKPLRKELEALSKVDLGRGFDEKDFLRRVDAAYKGLKKAQQDAQGPNMVSRHANAGNAAAALGSVQEIVRAARERGFEAGDAFDNAYQSRLKNMRAALPDLRVTAQSTPDERRAATLRQNIEAAQRLRAGDKVAADNNPLNLKVGVKLAAEDLKRVMGTLEGTLDQFAEHSGQIELTVAADKARAQAGAFFDDVKTAAEKAAEDQAREQLRIDEQNRKLRLTQTRREVEEQAKEHRAAREREQREEQKAAEELAAWRLKVARDDVAEREKLATAARQQSLQGLRREMEERAKALKDERERIRRDEVAAYQEHNQRIRESNQLAAEQLRNTTAGRVQQGTRDAASAIQNIPVHLQGEPAEREMAEIRQRLEKFGKLTIGVNADTKEFTRDIEREFVRLKAIAHDRNIRIDVRVDAAKAATELGGVLALVNRIDGQKAEVKIDTDRAGTGLAALANGFDVNLGRLGGLIALGASLGTAIVPAAAAAASAIGALGTAALAAGSGIGVMVLGLSGIGEAVKQMGNLADSQQKSSASLSRASEQVASAQEQVKNAEASLANTRRNNALVALKAQRSIKDAIKDQKDAVRDAARAISDATLRYDDARRSATKADLDAARAQLALSDAYREAQRALEDLSSQVRGNALDQRQATLDIAEAKDALEKVMTNPRATQAEREQADITYQQRLLQMEDLQRKGTELGDEQQKRQSVGLKGSKEVKQAEDDIASATERQLDAQRNVKLAEENLTKARLDAQDKIQKAQQKVTDAQQAAADQQADAAHSMLTATQAVISAQRSLRNASTSAGIAGGAAMDNLNTAMGKLSPTAQDFARYIFGLRDAFYELRRATDPMIAGLKQALQSLVGNSSKDAIKHLKPLFDFIKRVSSALGGIFIEFADTLKGPTFTRFFDYISKTAVPTLQEMYDAFENILVGLTNLFLAFTPLSDGVSKGFVDMTKSFRDWSAGLQTNAGFQKFMDYLRESGPKIAHLLKEAFLAVIHLVEAAAPIGTVVVGAFTKLFELINKIPQPVLTALVAGIAAAAAAVGALGLITTIIELGVEGLVTALVALVTVGLATLVGASGTLQDKLGALWEGIKGGAAAAWAVIWPVLKGIGQLFVDLWKLAAPTLQELGGVMVWLWKAAIVPAAKGIGQILQGLFDTIKPIQGAIISLIRPVAAIFWWLMQKVLVPVFKSLGFAFEVISTIVQVVAGLIIIGIKLIEATFVDLGHKLQPIFTWLGKALEPMRDGWNEIVRELSVAWHGLLDGWQSALEWIVRLINKALDAYNGLAKKFGANQVAHISLPGQDAPAAAGTSPAATANTGRATSAMSAFGASIKGVLGGSLKLTPAQQALADAQKVLADKTSTAEQKFDALKKALDTQKEAARNAIDANEEYHGSLLDLKDAVKQAKEQHDKNATSLGLTSRAGLANRDALEALITSSNKAYDADVALHGVTDKAIEVGKVNLQQIRDTAKHLGFSKKATEDLITAYNNIPKNKQTAIGFKAGEFEKVFEQLSEAKFIQESLAKGWSLEKTKATFAAKKFWGSGQQGPVFIPAKATGGPISGPGTKTSDSVLMWGSNGEFMQPAHAVDYYGADIMEAIRRKLIPRELFQGLAAGGPVNATWPFQIDIAKTLIPSVEDLQQKAFGILGNQQGGRGWQWQMSVLHKVFQGLGLISGFRKGARTLSGNLSYHALGRAVDLPPIRAVAEWIAKTFGGTSKELITPWRDLMLWNGKPHKFSRAIEAQHGVFGQNRHIHWAYDRGGLLPDTRSMPGGVMQVFHGRKTPDKVLTDNQWQNMATLAGKARESMRGGDTYNFPYRDTTLDIDELNRWTARRDALNRVNRVNY